MLVKHNIGILDLSLIYSNVINFRSQHGIKETTQLKDEAWLSVLIQGKVR